MNDVKRPLNTAVVAFEILYGHNLVIENLK